MSDDPSTIEGALKWAETTKGFLETGEPDMDSIALQTLSAAYRAEMKRADSLQESCNANLRAGIKQKARAELAERQYTEFADRMEHHSNERYEDMIARHVAEHKELVK